MWTQISGKRSHAHGWENGQSILLYKLICRLCISLTKSIGTLLLAIEEKTVLKLMCQEQRQSSHPPPRKARNKPRTKSMDLWLLSRDFRKVPILPQLCYNPLGTFLSFSPGLQKHFYSAIFGLLAYSFRIPSHETRRLVPQSTGATAPGPLRTADKRRHEYFCHRQEGKMTDMSPHHFLICS